MAPDRAFRELRCVVVDVVAARVGEMSAPVVLASGIATPLCLILLALVDPLKSSSTGPTTR